MPAGRPPLPLNSHGSISRTKLADGRWRARCRYRGPDGVTKYVQRDTPAGVRDSHGKQAEDALKAALEQMVGDGGGGGRITGRTFVTEAVELYMTAEVRGHKATRTTDTYERIVKVLAPHLGQLRVNEVTARGATRILQTIATTNGQVTARHAKTVLTGAFRIAVDEGAVVRSVMRDVELRKKRTAPKKVARSLSAEELVDLLRKMKSSEAPLPPMIGAKKSYTTRTVAQFVESVDLYDPILLAAATGLRRSELLGLLWADFDKRRGELTVTGHVIRGGKTEDSASELLREEEVKTELSARTVALPEFAQAMLDRRRKEMRYVEEGTPPVIFPSAAGTLRDPDTFASQWRRVRGAIGYGWVSLHGFRKSTATVLDTAGLTSRMVADVLGHASVTMTQDQYFGRGRTHQLAATALEEAVGAHLL
ncbi:site-specific integrase [Rhodococcus opacus]|uniref:Tyr recombinase domain-containing protein n=1 Tax=Rhodococcus opacus TaxID=37919 RepID=A0A2S8JAR6_RHOOP|nr:tyrosine-type recombinase/integrase [Rhodococcus opacus]PQP24136.1 hypothetical protein C5613_14750 [Rhodococcus opacus]